ncbi:MAG TPA: TrmH family RNA methyltransferase [Candidatus Paceibacterota bacterium]|nr:TrmH family RNA methyltransferase [Candidatus Paceibacterota bacterium]
MVVKNKKTKNKIVRSPTSRSPEVGLRTIVVVLPDIRSALNVGSIFRTADACGVNKIYLAGYTPAPVDQFGRADKQIAKTALGAEKTLAWEKVKSVSSLLTKLRKQGFPLIAIEQAKNSVDYKKISCLRRQEIKEKAAFIFGNEVTGLSKSILNKCDIIAEIPMRGDKESLNVAVSAGVALFRILDI